MAQHQLETERAEELASSLPETSGGDDESADVDAMTAEIDLSAVEGRSIDDQPASDDRFRAIFPGETTDSDRLAG